MNTDIEKIANGLKILDEKAVFPHVQAKEFLAALFREYFNRSSTVENFCEYCGDKFNKETMIKMLKNGKDCHELGY